MKKKIVWTSIIVGVVLIAGASVLRRHSVVVVSGDPIVGIADSISFGNDDEVPPVAVNSAVNGAAAGDTSGQPALLSAKVQTKKSSTGSGAATAAPATSKYLVTYTDKGFSPKTIQVARGQVVRFVNNSDASLLIVADDSDSPLLNEINQPKAVGKGGVYTFNFGYAGVWAYHNATKPDHHGNIVVY